MGQSLLLTKEDNCGKLIISKVGMEQAKKDFLKRVQFNQQTLADDLSEFVNALDKAGIYGELGVYQALTQGINVNKSERITKESLLSFFKKVYTMWYSYVTGLDEKKFSGKTKEAIVKVKNDPAFKPSNMSEADCYNFILSGYDKEFSGSGLRPANFQNEGCLEEDGEEMSFETSDFLHIYPTGQDKTECRLYLNLKASNAVQFTELLYEEATKRGLDIYTKFWISPVEGDDRNDTQLIYCSYDHASEIVDIIYEIKSKHPEVFEGCEKLNPLMGRVDGGFIGFGEEPQYKHSSFNSERADAISEFLQETRKERFKSIGNYTGTITNSFGQVQNLREYLMYFVRNALVEENRKKIEDFKKGKMPWHIHQRGAQAQKEYLEFLNNVQKELEKDTKSSRNQWINDEIGRFVDEAIAALKEGKCKSRIRMNFKTRNPNLSHQLKPDQNGVYMIQESYSVGMAEKLYKVFQYDKEGFSDVMAQLTPYFEKHHVSTVTPYLNEETQKEIDSSENY